MGLGEEALLGGALYSKEAWSTFGREGRSSLWEPQGSAQGPGRRQG